MQTTNSELIEFVAAARRYLADNEPPTKLTYALAKMLQRAKRPLTKYDEAMEDARNEFALSDEKTKAFLEGRNGTYQFDKHGTEKLTEKRRELLKGEIEIEPYFATELPPELRDDFRVAFEGFVIQV